MSTDHPSEVKFEIGHVLFIDIVGYSKLLINQQSDQLDTLKKIVRTSKQVRAAEAEGKLLRLPTGDGGALVFRTSPEAPVLCALEISEALKAHPELRVRIGIHSGPVNAINDLNEQANIAGAGINIAQRVMDCGDAGHILVSRHVAEDLEHYPRWQAYLHELGECEVKHGMRVSVVNLYNQDVGNPQLPERFKEAAVAKETQPPASPSPPKRTRLNWPLISAAILLAAAVIGVLAWRFKGSSTGPVSALPEKSIAILPFENLSGDRDNAFFADGVQDEILTDLAKIADLKVISRTSVMQYKSGFARNLREIGQALGVAHLLEGSVQRASGKVRVNAQLIDARTDAHLWAQTYDRDLADVFAIQTEIAKTIADQLQAKLSPKEQAVVEAKPTNDMAAYDLYLRASEIDRNRASSIGSGGAEGAKTEVQLLSQAVARDPVFVPALCKLANTHLYLHWLNEHSEPHVDLAKNAIDAAARLQPDAGEVHLARAILYYRGSLDYQPALAELSLAQRGLPNDTSIPFLVAMIKRRQGKWDESIRENEQAVTLDPRNVPFVSELATTLFVVRRYEEAARTLDGASAWKPNDFTIEFLHAVVDMAWKGDLTRWRGVVNGSARAGDPNDVISARLALALMERNYGAAEEALATPGRAEFDDNGMFMPREWVEGIIARDLGDKTKANAAFLAARDRAAAAVAQRPDDARALIVLGQIDAALGRKDDAIREGEHATQLLPVSKDAVNGGLLVDRLARIYAQVADVNRALDSLKSSIKVPNGPNYGSLKLEQDWDPLRGDPRFDKILASLAPKS
jgi:TolB-like protein/class 3 adenylate cyclase/Flp pilus assembly protein TadD